MLFPVVAHTDDGVSYGITIPDIPGCFTAGDTLAEALANIQEAVECHLEGIREIPSPGDVEEYLGREEYEGGVWILADIDLSFLQVDAGTLGVAEDKNKYGNND